MALLFRCAAHLPLGVLHAAGAALGWLTYAASPRYRQQLHANTAQAGLPAQVARAAVGQTGRMVAELPKLWLRPIDQPLAGLVRWHGTELLEAALAAGKGVLMVTPHLGAFEVIAQAYAERYGAERPITALFRPARKPWLRDVVAGSRDRPGLQTAPAQLSGVRQMIRALRSGGTVGLLPDQVPPQGQGVWAPFFGRDAYTLTLTGRLLTQTGAQLVPVWCERLAGGRGYAIHVEPMQQPLPGGDDALAWATALNQVMEQLIRCCPQQYLWGYARYKTPREQPTPADPKAAA
ncbi:MAG: lysophospholipid acyltransferase family protein [Burkholderiales bacterium]